jgi:hypothetical protein
VILNFSVSGINRAAGRLDSRADDPAIAKMHQTRLEELEAFLGGPWWRVTWQQGGTDRVRSILDEYLARFRAAFPGWKTLTVPVADYWDGPPSYYLVLLTEHDLGLWVFANAVSYGAKPCKTIPSPTIQGCFLRRSRRTGPPPSNATSLPSSHGAALSSWSRRSAPSTARRLAGQEKNTCARL